MKKTEKLKKEQKPGAPAKRKGLTELTDQDLGQAQGGRKSPGRSEFNEGWER